MFSITLLQQRMGRWSSAVPPNPTIIPSVIRSWSHLMIHSMVNGKRIVWILSELPCVPSVNWVRENRSIRSRHSSIVLMFMDHKRMRRDLCGLELVPLDVCMYPSQIMEESCCPIRRNQLKISVRNQKKTYSALRLAINESINIPLWLHFMSFGWGNIIGSSMDLRPLIRTGMERGYMKRPSMFFLSYDSTSLYSLFTLIILTSWSSPLILEGGGRGDLHHVFPSSHPIIILSLFFNHTLFNHDDDVLFWFRLTLYPSSLSSFACINSWIVIVIIISKSWKKSWLWRRRWEIVTGWDLIQMMRGKPH